MALSFNDLLSYQIGNNVGRDYLFAFASFVVFIVALLIFKGIIIHRLKILAKKTKTDFDDLLIKSINSVHWPFYVLISLFIASRFVTIPNFVDNILNYIIIVLVTYYLVRFLINIVDFGMDKIVQKRKKEEDAFDPSILGILGKIIKGVLWGIAIIIVLSNFGYDVTALAAGLGIGGIAIAFALQSILGDIFTAFSIHFDKPFKVGDFIIIGDDLGTVQHIGERIIWQNT